MRAGRTPSIPNALVASFERASDVRLAYVEFCYFFNTPGARFTYTLQCDCCLNSSQTLEYKWRAGRVEKLQISTYARHTSETARSKRVTSTLCTLGVRPARIAVCRKNHRAFRARLG